MSAEQVADAFAAYRAACAELERVAPHLGGIPRDPIARAKVSLAASSRAAPAVRLLHLGVARNNVEEAKRELEEVERLLAAKEQEIARVVRVDQLTMTLDERKPSP